MKDWRAEASALIKAKAEALRWTKLEPDQPCYVSIVFGIKPPAKYTRLAPTTKPDLDKLVRSCLDAITKAGNVWADDCQVVIITASKVYEAEPKTKIEVSID